MGDSGYFRWLRNSPPKPAANRPRRRENAPPPAAYRHRGRENAPPRAANRRRGRENDSPPMPAASRRRRRENSPPAANRRRRVNVEDSEPTRAEPICVPCAVCQKSCDGCMLTPYFPATEEANFRRIKTRLSVPAIRKVITELHTPEAVKKRLEELVEAVDMEKSIGILKLKKENAAVKSENDNLRKMLQENNKNVLHYLSTHTGAGMPNPAAPPYQATQMQYQAPQMQYQAPQMQCAYQPPQAPQMQYAYQPPQAQQMQYQAPQMPHYYPPQRPPHHPP